jgi:hypothetical protein
MKPTEQTKRHVISHYVEPARLRGEKTVQVRVGNVQRELGWTNRTPSVFSTLSSKEFQHEAGVELVERVGGPASGGPSTTWQFVYRLKDGDEKGSPAARAASGAAGLMTLCGIGAEVFRRLGGGESYLKAERTWGPDPWERAAAEKSNLPNGGKKE